MEKIQLNQLCNKDKVSCKDLQIAIKTIPVANSYYNNTWFHFDSVLDTQTVWPHRGLSLLIKWVAPDSAQRVTLFSIEFRTVHCKHGYIVRIYSMFNVPSDELSP